MYDKNRESGYIATFSIQTVDKAGAEFNNSAPLFFYIPIFQRIAVKIK